MNISIMEANIVSNLIGIVRANMIFSAQIPKSDWIISDKPLKIAKPIIAIPKTFQSLVST